MIDFESLIKELYTKAYLGKCRHFNAANRNKHYKDVTGLPGIIINILLGSVLFADLSDQIPNFVKWISAFLALGVTVLNGIQTYFNYQKKIEMHNKLGNQYLNIEHNLHKLYQKVKMNKLSADNGLELYEELDVKYQTIVNDAIPFSTNKADFTLALANKNLKKEKDPTSLLK